MTLPKFSLRMGLLVGLCATPIALLLALFSAGSGHGDYVLARVLYPIPTLATLMTNKTITGLSVGLALVQFPAYGAFVAPGSRTRCLALILVHAVAIAAAFSGVLDYFEG
ncbi:hypothetical protein DPM33_22040 [Mesorhizobium hawassense]|uniref:Uncharacterized protein n=1 Tax=Mesorhizobium hawassense TaxID=1209954 RepID=A0A330HLV3_9HYPH|nr:hypothetical protein [Mesorhizobium hawassense]RAZ88668.1 hypothetical protein DPM33_22040 [Mesorhizobium hawassense]